MKAMILAAGVGLRLRPLTDEIPKPLVDIGGVPLLELVIRRLLGAGVTEIIINTHHLPDKIAGFLKENNNFGIRIALSYEAELQDTGGGLKKAAWFFDDNKPFILHNADVFTNVDLDALLKAHERSGALATLSVRERAGSRYFLFDGCGQLCGWRSVKENRTDWSAVPVSNARQLAFDGIHIISPEIFSLMTENGIFSIKRAYLRLAKTGAKIKAFRSDGCYWHDIGDIPKLEAARRFAAQNNLPKP